MKRPATSTAVRRRPLRVPVLPSEKLQIQANARAAGKTVAAYLRTIGLGYQPPNMFDHRRVENLLKLNADQGRLGGLLKLWLTNDERTAAFGASTIRALLGKIEATQDQIHEELQHVLLPRSRRR